MNISVKGNSILDEVNNIDKYVHDFYYEPSENPKREYEERLASNGMPVDNKVVEDMLTKYFQDDEEYKKNTDLEKVLLKVTLLNSHYRTVIKNIDLVAIARHIISIPNFDKRLELVNEYRTPDFSLVKDIAYGSNEYKTKEMHNIYSFASKYCAWHQPNKFPIVDSYTKGMLYYINKDTNFYGKLTHKDLNDYCTYYNVYQSFIDYLQRLGICEKSYKEIDIFLWQYGLKEGIKSEESKYNS